MKLTSQYLFLAATLLSGLAAAQPPLFVPTPTTIPEPPLSITKDGTWPEDIPLPDKASDMSSLATPCQFQGSYQSENSLPSLYAFYKANLPASGWKLGEAFIEGEAYFSVSASLDGARVVVLGSKSLQDGVNVTIDHHASSPPAATPPDSAAEALLARMRAAYASAETYTDKGMRRAVGKVNPTMEAFDDPVAFTTSFRRPDQFRYEEVTEDERYILSQQGAKVRSYHAPEGEEKSHASLNAAYGDTPLVNGDISTLAAAMLMTGIDGGYPPATGARIIGQENIKGVDCDVVEGADVNCLPVRLWIGRSDALVRRMDSYVAELDMTYREAIEIEPVLNAPIPAEQLTFSKNGQLSYLDTGMRPSLLRQALRGIASFFE